MTSVAPFTLSRLNWPLVASGQLVSKFSVTSAPGQWVADNPVIAWEPAFTAKGTMTVRKITISATVAKMILLALEVDFACSGGLVNISRTSCRASTTRAQIPDTKPIKLHAKIPRIPAAIDQA